MSYILDALRRADNERERERGAVPGLHAQPVAQISTDRDADRRVVAGTLGALTQLDEALQKHASHWKVSRMSSLDRSLLRMATYELMYSKDVPKTVVIDEAIELAKQFGTAETPAFVNGVLDSIGNALPLQ